MELIGFENSMGITKIGSPKLFTVLRAGQSMKKKLVSVRGGGDEGVKAPSDPVWPAVVSMMPRN